jgi:hypothetical protein
MTLDEAIRIWNHRRANPKPDRTEEEIRRDRRASGALYEAGLLAYTGFADSRWVVTAKGRGVGMR